ncbi:DUF952 domain-containing protein [Hyphomicrobium sp.]|uniref:DUF952 domain-containing protein n=1 Tax=Hyphomicrobium sp. TaxID=82 RepID=UPI002D786F31|nr:DUF952 domain-containing protein [Hyphomicrobium sp.]HET6390206.1 DUF952 domain-containing protein [Hyphomicrobium sp.]
MKMIVYKIVTSAEWSEAKKKGQYDGSSDDRRDGFIHLSEGRQLRGTLDAHFKGKRDLLLIAFEASRLGADLKWEQSRKGDLFPHLYAPLDVSVALWERPLPIDSDGVHYLDEDILTC